MAVPVFTTPAEFQSWWHKERVKTATITTRKSEYLHVASAPGRRITITGGDGLSVTGSAAAMWKSLFPVTVMSFVPGR